MKLEAKMPRDAPTYPISSVDKALRLLLLLTERPAGIRVTEASDFLGVVPSTTHRLLQMLNHHGFAEQNLQNKTYAVGPVIRSLQNSRSRVLEAARPVLEDLAKSTKETVHIAALEGNMSLTLMSVESSYLLRVGDRVGQTQPSYLGAVGQALLLDYDGPALEELFPDGLKRGSLGSVAALKSTLKKSLKQGYTYQVGEIEDGIHAIGAPVRGNSGAIQFALGVTYPAGRIPAAQLPATVKQLKAAALALTYTLQA